MTLNWQSLPLDQLVEELGQGLQCLESRLSKGQHARIRFPRGQIRTVAHYEKRLSFLHANVTRKNIAYTLQAADVNRWLVYRFDLGLSAASAFMKQATITEVSVMEAILYADWSQHNSPKHEKPSFIQLIKQAEIAGRITPGLAQKLHEARHIRNNIHLYRVDHAERADYDLWTYMDVVHTESQLVQELGNA
ncbi:MAG: hypothetical protein C7B45_15725 [Sulfobacillus acidophilus]|uniref:Uncharacterized protein n=1 Tax=Sulfobacillus acidophilus TaxID=53633 RepID=A0A2T2WDF6_9FIRM|nr:MAG: hypothetical protein C7B45_15725 [Sulfobacillus acidophilus]